MLGNDDFKINLNILKKNEKKADYKVIHNKCLSFHEDFKIIGYQYVPLTPFIYKDWEKLDLIKEKETKWRKSILLEGKINNFSLKKFNLSQRKDTIEKDLNRLIEKANPRKLIFVAHSPPYNTSLDMISKKEHVGSKAIRKVIVESQPLVTLHGHVHETVKLSDKFLEMIGDSINITSGNGHIGTKLAIIEFDLYNPQGARRIII